MKLHHVVLSVIILLAAYPCSAEAKTSGNKLKVSKQTQQLLNKITKLSKEKTDPKAESVLHTQWKREVEEYAKNKDNLKKEEAVGKWFQILGRGRDRGRVVGVVRDFHFNSLQQEIDPLALFLYPRSYRHLLVKISPTDVPATLAFLQQQWTTFAPQRPFDFQFLDQEFDALYRAEERAGQLFGFFAGLAIFIACLGLFGLASFAAEQRTKEIGVRKVLGASVPTVVLLLSKDFTWLVLVAFVVAVPVAYVAMNQWLDHFAYRIDIPWPIFLVAGLAVLVVAWLTVSYQSVKAALANPVESLRYE